MFVCVYIFIYTHTHTYLSLSLSVSDAMKTCIALVVAVHAATGHSSWQGSGLKGFRVSTRTLTQGRHSVVVTVCMMNE